MSVATPFPWPTGSADTGIETCAETGLSLLLRNAPVAMVQCDALGAITTANPAFERLLGINPRSATAVLLSDLVQPKDREEIARLFGDMIAGRRESFRIENQVEHKSPRTSGPGTSGPGASERASWVRWTAWRARCSDKDSVFGVAIAEDTTVDHYTDRHRRQAGRLEALGRLASGVAHDFNNLLTGVILYSDLLLAGLEAGDRQFDDRQSDDHRSRIRDQESGVRGQGSEDRQSDERQLNDRLRKYAEEIRAAGVLASGLVRQLLAVARTPSEIHSSLSLNQVAEGMRQLLVRLIGENIELTYQLDPKLGDVRMDFTHAQQILLNLVLNARDAMPEGGRITLETRNCGLRIVSGGDVQKADAVELPCALFVVSDNGHGMDAQTQPHVFEAFFSTKPSGEGTGLGLSTVCDIVTNNGGLIHIDSKPKQGTRVTVLLPLIQVVSVPLTSLPVISVPMHSPVELPNPSPGNSKPPIPQGALPFPQEEPTP